MECKIFELAHSDFIDGAPRISAVLCFLRFLEKKPANVFFIFSITSFVGVTAYFSWQTYAGIVNSKPGEFYSELGGLMIVGTLLFFAWRWRGEALHE